MVSSPSAVNDGQWYHAAGVRSSSGYALYLDGQLVATRVEPARDADTSAPLVIGDLLSTGGYGFIGLVDEATIYRRALTSGEIATIYAAGSGGKCGTPRIVHGPASQVGSWGKTLTLSVVASGAAPFTYQWFKDGNGVDGATDASLTFTNLQFSDAGGYAIVVMNGFGSVTSAPPAYVSVNPAGVSIALYAGVTIAGVVGYTYGIQATTDLSTTTSWAGVANVTLSVPTQVWYDSQPASRSQRFYRVLPGPISIP